MKEEKAEPRYTKENLVNSQKYKLEKDLLNALLYNDETYTIKEVDEMIKGYKERRV